MKQYLKRLSELYYKGTPEVTNEEYDALEQIYGQSINGTGDVQHLFRMYSLNKHYDVDGPLPIIKTPTTKTPKLDGAAIDLTYIEGKLFHALTRGNGIVGRDVTEKVKTLPGVVLEIPSTKPTQITGEVVAAKTVENSRNYASGALNQKEIESWEQRKTDGNMCFVSYNVQQVQNRWGITEDYSTDMLELFNWGFNTITVPLVNSTGEDIVWEDVYPTDGIVYRISNNQSFNAMGFTDKFPKGAIAWKEKQESVFTTLIDVEWGTGKSGKVTPVAILEPVMIGEANVSRATLNNMAYIDALGLEIGCTVELIRAGEIIPKIIGRV